MRSWFCLLLLLSFGTVLEEPVAQKIFTARDIHVSWTLLTAPSIVSLKEELKEKGPRDKGQIPRYAYTGWKVAWRFDKEPATKAVTDISVETTIQMKLPWWNPAEGLSLTDRMDWVRVYQALLRHEYDHARMPRKTARTIERALKSILSSRQIRAPEANKIIRSFIRKNNEWDRWYDHSTRHGKTQGIEL